MKAIHADPKEIRKIFSDVYIIPEYQRPYSWEIEHCDKLWEDFISFYDSKDSKEEKYFLGNMVIHHQGDSFVVIDGQQRLTTLILLIKNLHSKAGTVRALEECLKIKDPLTSELTDKLRVNSYVLEEDKKHLYDIIFNNGDRTPDCNLKTNYTYLGKKVEEWWKDKGLSGNELNELILTLLDQVVMLPIHCGSEDDALTIFETINNRGMSLTDADIFKAKLHSYAQEEKDEFIDDWKELENHEWLFRIFMHINRAKEGDYGKEIALRTYFTFSHNNRLADWKSVMNSLKLIYEIEYNWDANSEINILWYILYTYPNQYWNYPLFVYLHKYGELKKDEFYLSEKYINDFTSLIEYTLKYFFIKGIVYNSVNAVKDTVFRVCVAIEKENNYLEEYKKNVANDYEEFEKRINSNQNGRYTKGLILLSAYLNPKQNKDNYANFLVNTYHIEHILPKKWNNYDGWNEELWEKNLNSLGNLIPLEYRLNISAKNEFFDRKKVEYRKSLVQDAIDLTGVSEWNPENWYIFQEEKQKRILEYIKL